MKRFTNEMGYSKKDSEKNPLKLKCVHCFLGAKKKQGFSDNKEYD